MATEVQHSNLETIKLDRMCENFPSVPRDNVLNILKMVSFLSSLAHCLCTISKRRHH